MEELVIESEISIPDVRKVFKYPHSKMKVGDSFVVPREDRQKVLNANWRLGKRFGMMFTSRTDGDWVRVWRVS